MLSQPVKNEDGKNTLFGQKLTLNCRGRLLSLSTPKIMGILNMTPDSFYDGDQYNTVEKALEQAKQMMVEGATIIDIGGASSRPGSVPPSFEEELQRVIPIIQALQEEVPEALISIDTFRAEVAKQALENGAHIINDISAGTIEPEIVDVAVEYQAPYIAMHMQNRPENMQDKPAYDDVLLDVMRFLAEKVHAYQAKGLNDIIIDPGFGFGKTVEDNYRLLNSLSQFKTVGAPILVGLSRKSMITKLLNITSEEALNATTALHVLSLVQGANILRVHDVKAAAECVKLVTYCDSAGR